MHLGCLHSLVVIQTQNKHWGDEAQEFNEATAFTGHSYGYKIKSLIKIRKTYRVEHILILA